MCTGVCSTFICGTVCTDCVPSISGNLWCAEIVDTVVGLDAGLLLSDSLAFSWALERGTFCAVIVLRISRWILSGHYSSIVKSVRKLRLHCSSGYRRRTLTTSSCTSLRWWWRLFCFGAFWKSSLLLLRMHDLLT